MPSIFSTKCCFCIPVTLGAFIMGYVLSIIKTLYLFLMCFSLMTLYLAISQHPELVTARTSFISCLQIVMAFLSCMEMIVSINLLVGLHMKQREHVQKFYRVYPIFMAFVVLTYLISLAVLAKSYEHTEWLLLIPDFIVLLFELYGIFIVRRCYLHIKNTDISWENPNQSTVYSARPASSNV